MGNASGSETGNENHSSLPKYIFDTAADSNGDVQASKKRCISTRGAASTHKNIVNIHSDNPNNGRVECVCCADDQRCTLKFPCGHLYCRSCIATLFKQSLKDRSLIPIRCCNTAIDQSWHQLVLTREDQATYAKALEEVQAANKMYCPNRSCAAFINLDKLNENIKLYFACPKCNLVICSACRASHPNINCEQYQALPVEDRSLDDQLFLNLAQNQRYARCGNCKHFVEKRDGCNNIYCRCRHQFCYACNAPTGSCVCGLNQHAPGNNYRVVYNAAAPPRPAPIATSAPPQPAQLPSTAAPAQAPFSLWPTQARGSAKTAHQKAGGSTGTARKDPQCQTHQWSKVNSKLEMHRCDNCLEKKVCFQNKCDTCGLRVCATCRFRRL